MNTTRQVQIPPAPDQQQKLAFMQRRADHDALDPLIVSWASRIARPFAPDDWMGIATELFHWVRDGIRYQRDPDRKEELAPARIVLARGWDDCDGKVRLFVAGVRALGLEGRFFPIWRAGQLSHVMAAVKFAGSEKLPRNQHGWLIGDLTIRGAELGQNPYTIASNPDTGKLPLSGGPPPRFWIPHRG